MRLGPDPLERLLARLRDANPPVMTALFLRGQCYQLWVIVREVFPDAEFWEIGQDHGYVRWNGKFYDIRGRVHPSQDGIDGRLRRSVYTKSHLRANRRDRRFLVPWVHADAVQAFIAARESPGFIVRLRRRLRRLASAWRS